MESTSGRRGGAAGGAGGAAPEPGAPRSASLPRRPRRGGARRLPDPLPRRGGVRRLPDLSSIVGRDSAVICSKYSVNVESSSRFDRRALNCLINYYLDIDTFPLEETPTGCRKELFTRRELDSVADVTSCPSSKMGKVHADVLQDILANGILADDELFDEKSAVLLLAFLSSHLTNDKKLDQLKSLINTRLDYQSPVTKMSTRRRSRGKNDIKYQSPQTDKKDGSRTNQERAATIIQTQARSVIAKNKYCMREKAIFTTIPPSFPLSARAPSLSISTSPGRGRYQLRKRTRALPHRLLLVDWYRGRPWFSERGRDSCAAGKGASFQRDKKGGFLCSRIVCVFWGAPSTRLIGLVDSYNK